MRKVLITGFDPFGGETINPAFEAVKLLPDQILDAADHQAGGSDRIWQADQQKTVEAIRKATRPDFVLCIGQAGGRCPADTGICRHQLCTGPHPGQ